MSFTFDKVGNILTKTTFQSSTTSYVYNAANRLVMLRNPDYTQVDYQYDPAGRLLSRVTAAGARASYQYDANGWMSKLTQYDAANATISDTSYTRDRVGNILTQADSAGTSTYALDALYRLKTADYPGTANDEAFDYDKVGNRKLYTKGSLTANASTRYYNYTAGTNRLSDIRIGSAAGTTESSFSHDFEGRLTSQTGVGAKTLTWDAKGRVKTVGAETYSYDPMDYRIGRSGGSLGNRSYFLEGEHLESEYSGGTLQAKYFRGSSIDELVAGYLYDTDSKLKPFLFHQDQITSTTAVSGHNGGTTQSIKYAAFGAVQSSTGSSPNRQKYAGREDDGNGLLQYRARSYDPAIGRFISEDPMGFGSGDMSFYVYAANSPIDNNDPSGHNPVTRFIRESAEYLGVKASAAAMQAAKNRAVDMAWKAESQLIKNNLPGTRSWGPDELKFLQQGKPVPGYAGHHINSANGYPTLAGNPDNIQFLRAGEHSSLHSANGGTQVPTYGSLVDRTAGGALPRVADSSGFSLKSTIIGGAVSVLSGVSQAAEFLDAIDPSSVIFNIPSTGGCNAGRCSDMVDWSKFGSQSFYSPSAPANGGFLLYPNKPNNNMMQSVYSK